MDTDTKDNIVEMVKRDPQTLLANHMRLNPTACMIVSRTEESVTIDVSPTATWQEIAYMQFLLGQQLNKMYQAQYYGKEPS